MMNRLFFFLLALALGSAGCKRQRFQQQTLPPLVREDDTFLKIDSIPEGLTIPVEFDYLTTRSKISLKSSKQNIDNASVTFRIRKDSVIWMSASVMGMEVIRGAISSEGVRIMDRINKVYTEASYRVLAQRFGFPLDYPLLQSLFLADIPVYPGQRFEISRDDSITVVKQADPYLSIYNVIDHLSKKTVSMEAIDLVTSNKARADYSGPQHNVPGKIPGNASITLSVRPKLAAEGSEEIFIFLTHTNIDLADSTLSFPFHVPNTYKKSF